MYSDWQTRCRSRWAECEEEESVEGLSESNPGAGGGGVCPIVTQAQRCFARSRIGRGMVNRLSIFISATRKCVTSVWFTGKKGRVAFKNEPVSFGGTDLSIWRRHARKGALEHVFQLVIGQLRHKLWETTGKHWQSSDQAKLGLPTVVREDTWTPAACNGCADGAFGCYRKYCNANQPLSIVHKSQEEIYWQISVFIGTTVLPAPRCVPLHGEHSLTEITQHIKLKVFLVRDCCKGSSQRSQTPLNIRHY